MALLSIDLGLFKIASLLAGIILIYEVISVIYVVFLHPLRKYPGPFWWKVSRLPYSYYTFIGTFPFKILDLHKQYGEVVRIAPDELAFSNHQAWKDIHGHRAQGQPTFQKWKPFYRPIPDMPTDIVNSEKEEHVALRRLFSHGFSDRSMREQEPIIKKYIDLLISRLYQHGQGGTHPVDLAAWFNFTTFDVIGDLAFGEPFGCLDTSGYHPWVKGIFQLGRVGTVIQIGAHYPIIKKILFAMVPAKAKRERESHITMNKEKLKRRMEIGKDRPDLIEGLLKTNMDMDKLEANSSILIIAGSETTATLLAGCAYLLMTHPKELKKLVEEIRGAFKSDDEITFQSVTQLPYLQAVLEEALRLYPPAANGLPRITPVGGAEVAGHFVPENTIVAIHEWAISHDDAHFKDPFGFHPERWLDDPEYASDHKDARQPFNIGPRNCLGRNLAYNEMRAIFAKLLWHFDIKIANDSLDWLDRQKVFNFWNKGVLNAYVTPVQRS